MTSNKLLVIGSGGCLGSNLIRYILKNYSEYKIASLDYCTHPNITNIIYSNKGHSFHVGNVNDEHLVDVIFQIERPDIVINTISQGLPILSQYCNKYGCKLLFVRQDENFYIPQNSIAIKVPDYFGPKQQKSNLVPFIIYSILNNKQIPIKGMQIRDWIHVQDICSSIIKIIKHGKENDIFDVTANNKITDLELFQEICNIFNRGHELITTSDSDSIEQMISLDNKKIKELDWLPLFKFKSGLTHTVNWYQNNQWFLKDK